MDNKAFTWRISFVKPAYWVTLFVLSACSGGGGSDSPSAPVAAADAYVYPSTQTLTVTAPGVLGNDTGASLTAVLVTPPVNAASFTLNPDGSFTYKSSNGTSNDSFSYKATNANGSSNVTTVSLARNQPPAAVNACLFTPSNTSLNGTLTATDEPASGPDTYMLVSDPVGPHKGNVTVYANGTFTYMPNLPSSPSGLTSFLGMDQFKFQVTDKFGLTSYGIATVLIDGAVRIMPLGDSITQGVYTGGGCEPLPDGDCPLRSQRISYRKKLWTDLEALSPSYAVDMIGSLADGWAAGLTPPDDQHEGHPGDCATSTLNSWCSSADFYDGSKTRNLADNIITWLNTNQADIILLHVGTNGLNFTTPAINANAVDTLLTDIDSWAQSNYPVTVFLARIIPSVDGSLDVNTFNNDIAAIPAANHPHINVIMVDEQSQLRLASDPNKADPTYMTTGNNLHPNQTGYDRMADKWELDMKNSGVLPSCP